MKLSTVLIAGMALAGAASASHAASVFELYNYGQNGNPYDTANVGVTNTDSFTYTDVTVAGIDLGSLAPGASASANIGDPGEGGPYSGVVSILVGGTTSSGTFNFPDYDYATTQTLGSITVAGGGVPEPATWALMLVGFGGLGVAMRSRRRAALTA